MSRRNEIRTVHVELKQLDCEFVLRFRAFEVVILDKLFQDSMIGRQHRTKTPYVQFTSLDRGLIITI